MVFLKELTDLQNTHFKKWKLALHVFYFLKIAFEYNKNISMISNTPNYTNLCAREKQLDIIPNIQWPFTHKVNFKKKNAMQTCDNHFNANTKKMLLCHFGRYHVTAVHFRRSWAIFH